MLCSIVLFGCSSGRTLDSAAEGSTAYIGDAEKPYRQIISTMNNLREVTEEKYLDEAGKLVDNEDGYAIKTNDYDKKGNLIRTAYYDTREKAVFVEKLGYSYMEFSYDDEGNKIAEKYFDVNGNTVALPGSEYALSLIHI